MKLYKKCKFITFTSVGLCYDIIAAFLLGLFYSPSIPNPYAMQGQLRFLLENQNARPVTYGLTIIVFGFFAALVDHLLDIYKPKNKYWIEFWKILLGIYTAILIILLILFEMLAHYYFKHR